MPQQFDSNKIAELGWRQGSMLGPELARKAKGHAPERLTFEEADVLLVTSHDCDIVNGRIEKEPVVEVLRATIGASGKADQDGRNPRILQLVFGEGETAKILDCSVHDRWTIPRASLMDEGPTDCLPDRQRRLIAEWLAKRYIRAAFPSAFDRRWRSKLNKWKKLLKKHSHRIQGVYLRLNTLDELAEATPYKCDLLLAVPEDKVGNPDWPQKSLDLIAEFEAFWKQFEPGIECIDVNALGTDEITLAQIEKYQRFDADWVSFADDSPTSPMSADMMM